MQDLMKAIIENWLASSKFSLAINHPSSSDLCNKAESATQQRPDDRSNSCRLTGRFDADGGSNCSGNIRGVSCAGWVGCHRGITRQDFRSISSIGFELFLCVPVLIFFFLLSSIDIINSSTRHIKSQIRKTSDSSSSPHCSGVHRGTV